MAICFVTDTAASRLESASYPAERDLEAIIAANSYLLLAEDEPELRLIGTQVNLPGTGIADLLFLDETGRLTVAEVKLGRNGEGRRSVVGQVLDYASTLADRTVFEVDEMTRGGLDKALRTFAEEGDYEQLLRACATALRAGDVRVVVVMDDPSQELIRIMSFLNDHTDLDVRLVSVSMHEQPGGRVYVPRLLVHSAGPKAVERAGSRAMSSELAAVVAAFDRLQPEGLTTLPGSRSTGYRQIRVPDWPRMMHYEFYDRGDRLMAEFHAEVRELGSFTRLFNELVPIVRSAVEPHEVSVNPSRWKGLGALAVAFPRDGDPEAIARGMGALIAATIRPIGEEIASRQQALTHE